jgi:hypothetical protein
LAYTRYVLDAGMRGDLLALKVALAPLRDRLRGDCDAARRATPPWQRWQRTRTVWQRLPARSCHRRKRLVNE